MDMERIKILSNIGSASKKYSVYQGDIEIAWFHFEKNGDDFVVSYKIHSKFEKKMIEQKQYHTALLYISELLIFAKVIQDKSEIIHIALRVVVPHADFVEDKICTDEVLEQLKSLEKNDPIHIVPALEEIQIIKDNFLEETRIYIISDSAFHKTARKKIPLLSSDPFYTIGYHGLSCESVVSILDEKNIFYTKLIIAHLGGGSSVSAIVHGISVYNSMDFSPLAGPVMSSRSGSIDPFLILSYMQEHNLSYEEMIHTLYHSSGLYALSDGLSNDLRDIREHAFKGNYSAKQAIIQYVDSITEHICAALSYARGVDTLVFTGTIGYRAHWLREMIIEKLSWLGAVIDHTDNMETQDICFEISAFESKIKIYVVAVDEMKEMHKHLAKNLLK